MLGNIVKIVVNRQFLFNLLSKTCSRVFWNTVFMYINKILHARATKIRLCSSRALSDNSLLNEQNLNRHFASPLIKLSVKYEKRLTRSDKQGEFLGWLTAFDSWSSVSHLHSTVGRQTSVVRCCCCQRPWEWKSCMIPQVLTTLSPSPPSIYSVPNVIPCYHWLRHICNLVLTWLNMLTRSSVGLNTAAYVIHFITKCFTKVL